jgi:hypothetical protein
VRPMDARACGISRRTNVALRSPAGPEARHGPCRDVCPPGSFSSAGQLCRAASGTGKGGPGSFPREPETTGTSFLAHAGVRPGTRGDDRGGPARAAADACVRLRTGGRWRVAAVMDKRVPGGVRRRSLARRPGREWRPAPACASCHAMRGSLSCRLYRSARSAVVRPRRNWGAGAPQSSMSSSSSARL